MKNSEISNPILHRLLTSYGTLLTLDELAIELRTTKSSIYNRRSRGNASGLPDPIPGTTPHVYRAAEIAQWLAGEFPHSDAEASLPKSKGKIGRPRKGVAHAN